MTIAEIDRILQECAYLTAQPSDPELRAVSHAILIEDAFGVTLTEEQLATDLLEDPENLRTLLIELTGSH